MPPTIRTRCVTRNRMKIGVMNTTDSRTPRRFRIVSPISRKASTGTIRPCQSRDTRLNRASPAAAIDTVIVST